MPPCSTSHPVSSAETPFITQRLEAEASHPHRSLSLSPWCWKSHVIRQNGRENKIYHVSLRLEQFVICHLGSQSLDLIAFQGGGIRRMDPMKTTPSQRLEEKFNFGGGWCLAKWGKSQRSNQSGKCEGKYISPSFWRHQTRGKSSHNSIKTRVCWRTRITWAHDTGALFWIRKGLYCCLLAVFSPSH